MRGVVRLSVKVPASVDDTIRKLAAQRETTVTEVIRDAIATEKWLDDERRAGRTVLVRAADGSERELVWTREVGQ